MNSWKNFVAILLIFWDNLENTCTNSTLPITADSTCLCKICAVEVCTGADLEL